MANNETDPRLHRACENLDGSTQNSWDALHCGHCGADVQAAVISYRGDVRWLLCTRCLKGSVKNQGVASPPSPAGISVQGLPAGIEDAYEQARNSFSVAAYTGVELVCRKILMHVGVDKGAEQGKRFAEYIDYLSSNGYVTPAMHKWVKLIKDHGNQATHELPESTRNRAESTLMFTGELLRLTYEMEYLANIYTSEDVSGTEDG